MQADSPARPGLCSVMMKIVLFFLFFATFLIKGHMGEAVAVTGITGGSVNINCKYKIDDVKTKESAKSFCKVSGDQCTTMTGVKNDLWIAEERFSMTDNKSVGLISVLIRNLSVNDSGVYRCDAGSVAIRKVNLNVTPEPCCGRSEEQTAHVSTTPVIHCKYPEQFTNHSKHLFRVQNGSLQTVILTYGGPYSSGRFSLNVNDQERVFTVTVSNVSSRDAGVYFCGIRTDNFIYTLLTEIHLHVSDASVKSDLYIIITVWLCLILLSAAGLSLLWIKRRCKSTEGSVSSDQRNTRGGHEVNTSAYYEEIQYSAQDSIGLNTVYATPHLPTSPSGRDFYTLAGTTEP